MIDKIAVILLLVVMLCCSADPPEEKKAHTYSLSDFYSENTAINNKVDLIFKDLDPKEKIGQMIITSAGTTGKPTRSVENLIRKKRKSAKKMRQKLKKHARKKCVKKPGKSKVIRVVSHKDC